jgi:hypothetical protein
MRFPVDEFLTNWNITAGYSYGDKTSYGYHEADDININAGGNADLGQPVYAVADGEITSVHTHTGNPTFGKHIHLKFQADGRDFWAHYAHLNEVLVTEGTKVKKGDKIGTVGNTGTTFAHLHFAIKNQPTGIDGIAKTLEDLKKWENPTDFIKRHFVQEAVTTISEAELTKIRLDRDTNWNLYQEEKRNVEKLTNDLKVSEERIGNLLTELERINNEDKSTSEQLITAQHTITVFESDQKAIREALGLLEFENIIDAINKLKVSKTIQSPKPKSFIDKLVFLFS